MMGSGAVQVGAEIAEQHQVRGGKWFHDKVFQRGNPPLRAISPPLANQTHILPLNRNPTTVLCRIPVNITPGPPRRPQQATAGALFLEVLDSTDDDPTLLLPGLSGLRVDSIAAPRHGPGLFMPGRAVDASGAIPPDSRSCPSQVEFMSR